MCIQKRPPYVLLDTSQICDFVRDLYSSERVVRDKAQKFLSDLRNLKLIPFLTFHHLQELLAYDDEKIAARRFHFLESLPLVARLRTKDGEGLGTIVNVFAAEITVASWNPGFSIDQVEEKVRSELIVVSSGEDTMRLYAENWRALREYFKSSAARDRELVAISRSGFVDLSNVNVNKLISGRVKSPEKIKQAVDELEINLASDIASRGDKRIPDASATSREFMNLIRGHTEEITSGKMSPFDILGDRGIRADDVKSDTILGELSLLSEFRTKVQVASENCRLPNGFVGDIPDMLRIPTWVITCEFRTHAQDHQERKGSELADIWFVCMAPYVDSTFVDKRTYENFLRARRKSVYIESLSGRLRRSVNYDVV